VILPRRKPGDVSIDVQRHAARWRHVPGLSALVRKAAKRAIALSGVPVLAGAELSVSLADDTAVAAANRDWRKKDAPTNVLSFPAVTADRIAHTPFLGDVILAFETVAREALAEGKTMEDHTAHLVVHGVLHVLGYDHMTKDQAERMEALETLILASLAIADPYGDSEPLETPKA
jgi:probable rRNA maturation factor